MGNKGYQRRLHFFDHNNELMPSANVTSPKQMSSEIRVHKLMNSSFSSSTFCRPSVEAVDERKTRRIDWELHHGIYPARRIYSKRWNVTPTVNHRCMEVRSTTFVPRGFSPRLRLAPSPPPPVNSAPALRERETSGTQGIGRQKYATFAPNCDQRALNQKTSAVDYWTFYPWRRTLAGSLRGRRGRTLATLRAVGREPKNRRLCSCPLITHPLSVCRLEHSSNWSSTKRTRVVSQL